MQNKLYRIGFQRVHWPMLMRIMIGAYMQILLGSLNIARQVYADDDFGVELDEPSMISTHQQLIYAFLCFHGQGF